MTEQEFYQKLLAELDKSAENDKQLSALLDKIQSGQADFSDSSAYWQKLSGLIGSVLSRNVIEAGSGLNEEVSYLMLKSGHMRAFQIMSMVQKALDERQNIHINAVNPAFPEERARKASHSLEDKTVSQEVLQRRAENAIANIANSFHDDYIKENASFRQKAGLTCHVNRIGASKCCAWCAEVAGRYEVSRAPADFWRRHDRCSCQIIYETSKFRQRLSGTGRGWKVDSEVHRRQVQAIQYKPARFTREQAQALEQQNLRQYRGLTEAENSKLKTDTPQTIVNNSMLYSPEYRNLFDKLGESTKITRKIFQNSRKALLHRTGTEFEDLIFINSDTGEVYSRTDYNVKRQVMPSKKMKQMVLASPNIVISIHNHPGSAVPSLSDINSCRDRKYKYGIIACHNGNLFKYTILDSSYPESYSDMLLDKINYLLYNNDDSTDKTTNELNQYLGELEKIGISLEVFKWK